MLAPNKDLSILLHTHYQHAQTAFNAVVAEEKQLRQRLLELSDFERKARADLDINPTPRMIGADTLWQSWLGRSRADLNTQLANVLARKAVSKTSLSLAYGRKIVAEELSAAERERMARRKAKADQDMLLRLASFESTKP